MKRLFRKVKIERTLLVCVLMAFSTFSAFAQSKTVSGTVFDETNQPLIGVSIVEDGTTNGTISDFDGKFTLTVDPNSTITFSFIGYTKIQESVAGKSEINVTLQPDNEVLEDVVVTALGIKREKKALGYSMQELDGSDVSKSGEVNMANSLSGKVAGLQVRSTGTGVGGSTRLTIRGNSSLTGSNQPLIVVDGIPMDNFSGDTDDQYGSQNVDTGNGLSDINPDDIESMSVLKGPAAAALYGSRAGNGVVLITTKSGKAQKGVGISYSGTFSWETPLTGIDMQNTYGQGNGGIFQSNSEDSWGPAMNGQEITDYTGQTRPFSAYDNDINDFLDTGFGQTHSISMDAGSEKVQFRGGMSYQNTQGIVPNHELEKYTANIRTTAKLTDKLTLDAKINYINNSGENRPKVAGDPDNVFYNYLSMPRSIHYSDLENYRRADNSPYAWTDVNSTMLNPYWTVNLNTNEDTRDRMLGMGSLKYEFTDWLSMQVRQGIDYYSQTTAKQLGTGTPYWGAGDSSGDYQVKKKTFKEVNSDFLITAQNRSLWGSDFGGSLILGGNMMKQTWDEQKSSANGLIVEDFYSINNGQNPLAEYDAYEKRINSIYASGQLSYKNYLYLDVTARNDWSSTLPSDNNSYFYPSVGLGWVISDAFELPQWITFAKARGSFAQVGNDTDPYNLSSYAQSGVIINGVPAYNYPSEAANENLKPEIVNSIEGGLEMKFINNRLGFDFTYYKMNATNQIIPLDIDPATGYSSKWINAGDIQNEGIEFTLNASPIQNKNFTWDILLNHAINKNKVIELTDESPTYILSGSSQLIVTAVEGGDYGNIEGTYMLMDDATGLPILDNEGLPTESSDTQILGNYQPDFTGGITNSFTYKNFDFSFLIDWSVGGEIYSGSAATAASAGTLAETEGGRTAGIVIEGVDASGQRVTSTVSAETYWKRMADINERWVYDASYVKLREVSLGYNLPKRWYKGVLQNARVSFVGRNLWLIVNNLPGIDPESSYSTSNAQGLELGSAPSTSSYNINIKVTF